MYFLIILFITNIFFIYYFKTFAKLIKLFDVPDGGRKIHKKTIASIGGFLIFINLILYFFFVEYKYFYLGIETPYFNNFDFIIFFIFSTLFFFLGFLDDKFNLNSNLKLTLFSLFIIILLLSEKLTLIDLKFSFLKNSINIESVSYPFLILCMLLFLNAFNMFDGINLQSSVYSLCIFSIFILKGIFVDISLVMILSLIFFSYLNFKNKCFLGNNGALMLAFIISYLFIKSQSTSHPFSADEIFLAMQIPGLDLLRLAIQRILNNKHPFHPDKNHIHHILLEKIGYNKTILIISSIIVVPNYLSIFQGNTLYCVILTLFLYSFIIFKFSKLKY
jgi:UDP-GlcNAc:undecaprenyl-phosphate GlcNAc-1-phosphate transferase